MYAIIRRTLIALFVVTALSGCGGDEPGSSNNIISGIIDMGVADATTMDDGGNRPDAGTMADGGSADMDVEADMSNPDPCQGVRCELDETCVEGSCVARDICDSAIDAGMLSVGGTAQASGSFLTSGSDQSTASCGEAGQLEQLIKFEVTENAEVSWSVDWGEQFDGVVALRTACDEAQTESECSDIELGSALLEPGIYFLYLEVRFGNPGGFDVDLEATAPPSCQAGSATCDGDDRLVCLDGTNIARQTCPGTCVNGVCAGDSCAEPITISGAGGTFTGTGNALTSSLDFAANSSCAEVAGMSTSTPGYDLVFYLPNLLAGQIIVIDADTNDANINDIFVQQTCGANDMCVDSFQSSEAPDFVVQSPGDYYVIIDKRQASNPPFHYSISVQ